MSKETIDELTEKIDKLSTVLANMAETEAMKPADKVKVFSSLVAWAKIKNGVNPDASGGRLKEMSDGLNSSERTGSKPKKLTGAALAAHERKVSRASVGNKIHRIIDNLPSRNAGSPSGDKEDSVGKAVSDSGDAGSVQLNGNGDVEPDDIISGNVH